MFMRGESNEAEAEQIVKYVVLDEYQSSGRKGSYIILV